MGGDRPEHSAPPEVFYNDSEARKYTTNTRMVKIQESLTQRALELLALPDDGIPKLLLDIGCGSGLSGETLTEEGHQWVGLDISQSMLNVAAEREVEGDLGLHDMGHGLCFRQGTFDGAISISAVQWLCNADKQSHNPRKRMKRFFETLYSALNRGARAILQIYPENVEQAQMLTNAAMRVGFTGGLVVDFPHSTRAKKYFLCLMVGQSNYAPQARGLNGSDDEDEDARSVAVSSRQRGKKKHGQTGAGSSGGVSKRHPEGKGKAWILKKKAQMRAKGYGNIPADSTKYTGRKRKTRF
mmetsp:Transcript_19139/g.53361  ORF Transcript_19139/g.53361 Transcript_19139/m.53361 type:complete len:298 (+) Transcript_19139:133-1026(+)|eukprot:CAMPEP_0117672036 /NCGR_PEP_ID=MMETSP0804-20121206/13678_1 /TAXON_ID=1074897 /ORGANISM="Tetraselmis astigmatica, Strain CCMP880" /LENGTH=297 /DNA_ID=CAMNT_0005480587 /DNA_START=62 /DNA_END=955 /DNA_ORIENTATION=-